MGPFLIFDFCFLTFDLPSRKSEIANQKSKILLMVECKFTGVQQGPENISVGLTSLGTVAANKIGEALAFRGRWTAGQRCQVEPLDDLRRRVQRFERLFQDDRAAG